MITPGEDTLLLDELNKNMSNIIELINKSLIDNESIEIYYNHNDKKFTNKLISGICSHAVTFNKYDFYLFNEQEKKDLVVDRFLLKDSKITQLILSDYVSRCYILNGDITSDYISSNDFYDLLSDYNHVRITYENKRLLYDMKEMIDSDIKENLVTNGELDSHLNYLLYINYNLLFDLDKSVDPFKEFLKPLYKLYDPDRCEYTANKINVYLIERLYCFSNIRIPKNVQNLLDYIEDSVLNSF